VNDQSDTQQSQFRPGCHGGVCEKRRILMQRMISDAAARGIVNRIRQQVINIHDHRRYHREPRPQEILPEEGTGNRGGHQQVQEQVNNRSEHEDLTMKKAAQNLGGR
jgi:hypothetical protein